MKINTSNTVATEALWTALVGLADNKITAEQGVAAPLRPYSVLHITMPETPTNIPGHVTQHILIQGNNDVYKVARKVGAEEVTYEHSVKGVMIDIVHDNMLWTDLTAIASDTYLGGLIQFVNHYRNPEGRATRERIAEEEVLSLARRDDNRAFDEMLSNAMDNRLTAHSFYDPQNPLSDREQLMAKPQPKIDAGTYSYASFAGGGQPDTLVIVSSVQRNAVIAYRVEGKVRICFDHLDLDALLAETRPRVARLLNNLADNNSVTHQVFDMKRPDATPREHSHSEADLHRSLRFMGVAMCMADAVAALRASLTPGEIDELPCPGCGGQH